MTPTPCSRQSGSSSRPYSSRHTRLYLGRRHSERTSPAWPLSPDALGRRARVRPVAVARAPPERAGQPPGHVVGGAEVADLTLVHEVVERPQRLLERRLAGGRTRPGGGGVL